MVLSRLVRSHFIDVIRAELQAKASKAPSLREQRESGWDTRVKNLSQIPQCLFVVENSNRSNSSRHRTITGFTTLCLPDGRQEKERWIAAQAEGKFQDDIDLDCLWNLFHPRARIIYLYRFAL
jgi:hypothetical protein